MIHRNFAWTFAVDDRKTVDYVRERFIPKLQTEVSELRQLHAFCVQQHSRSELDLIMREKQDELAAARIRLADKEGELAYTTDDPDADDPI